MLLTASILIIEFVVLRSMLRYQRFLAFPHGLMVYLMFGQFMYYAVTADIVEYEFMKLYSTASNAKNYAYVQGLFFMLFLIPWFIARGLRLESVPPKEVTLSGGLLAIMLLVTYAFAIIHLALIDKHILWENEEYLLMTSPSGLMVNDAFTKLFVGAFEPMGLIIIASAVIARLADHLRSSLLFLPAIAWWFAFELAAHSRTAAFYLLTAAVLSGMASKRRWVPVGLSIAGIITLFSVLGGRVEQHHGLSDLPNYFKNIQFAFDADTPLEPLLNLFEGFFTTSELLVFQGNFSESYKLLSFSPFPSIIDGFDVIRDADQIMLHEYVPMGAMQEIFSFGPVYVVFYFVISSLASWINLYAMKVSPAILISTFNNFLLAASWYLGLTYPVRSVFKFFWLSMIMDGAAILLAKRKERIRREQERSEADGFKAEAQCVERANGSLRP